MELFLNILWVLMAAGVLWTWRARWIHQRKRSVGHSIQEWTAVSVALVLLFFAVSMTDDLHWEMVLSEESSTSRRSSSPSLDAQQPSMHTGMTLHGAAPALVAPRSSFELSLLIQTVALWAEPSSSIYTSQPPSDRSPPHFSV